MDFNLSEEQEMLRDSADRFVKNAYSFEQRRKLIVSADGFSRGNWAQFAELGWLMLNVPEAAGGLGASLIETSILLKSLGRGMLLEPFVTTAVLSARLLERASTNQTAQDLLARIAVGECLATLAHAEAESFANTALVATTAQRDSDGYRLSGRKFMALDAPSADVLLVSAVLDGDAGYSLFIVNAKAEGVNLDEYPLINGARAADIALYDVIVPVEARLDYPIGAKDILEEAVDRATVATLAAAVGAMDACLEVCGEYVRTRKQFGQPIGKFQALQHIMAEMFVCAQESHSILYQALGHIDSDDCSARQRAVSAAKIVIGQALHVVMGQAIQLHGGYGITDEYAVSHFYKYGVVIEKMFGDGDAHIQRFLAAG